MGENWQPKDLFFQLSMMEYKQWKSLQRMFGDVANVYISCLDGQGHEMMEASGDKADLEKLRQYMDAEQLPHKTRQTARLEETCRSYSSNTYFPY